MWPVKAAGGRLKVTYGGPPGPACGLGGGADLSGDWRVQTRD